MTGDLRLFEVADIVDVDVPDGLSYTRRLTLRRQMLLERGVHPATRLPLRDGAACGSCAHHLAAGAGRRTFHKCDLAGVTRGPATDIRTSWPACTAWQPDRPATIVDVPVAGAVL